MILFIHLVLFNYCVLYAYVVYSQTSKRGKLPHFIVPFDYLCEQIAIGRKNYPHSIKYRQ